MNTTTEALVNSIVMDRKILAEQQLIYAAALEQFKKNQKDLTDKIEETKKDLTKLEDELSDRMMASYKETKIKTYPYGQVKDLSKAILFNEAQAIEWAEVKMPVIVEVKKILDAAKLLQFFKGTDSKDLPSFLKWEEKYSSSPSTKMLPYPEEYGYYSTEPDLDIDEIPF